MTTKEYFDWERYFTRWIRRAEFWKFVYKHSAFNKKIQEKARMMNEQCVEMASAYIVYLSSEIKRHCDLLEKSVMKEGF